MHVIYQIKIISSHLMLTWWPIMQKVRSCFLLSAWAAYKTTISKKFSLTVLFTVAHVLYLAFEEGSP